MVVASEDPSMKGLDVADMELMRVQLQNDMTYLAEYKLRVENDSKREGPKLNLLAMWLPREGSCFDKSVSFVNRFATIMRPELYKAETSGSRLPSPRIARQCRSSRLTWSFPSLSFLFSARMRSTSKRWLQGATLLLTKTFLNENKNGNKRSNDPKRLRME
jgi:hypothetical protein